jgi:hypothetical protein
LIRQILRAIKFIWNRLRLCCKHIDNTIYGVLAMAFSIKARQVRKEHLNLF